MRRPLLVDLYCCAGGAAKGYHDAGFDVIGFDIEPQPNYPFPFTQVDVLRLTPHNLAGATLVHASPPCHERSTVAGRARRAGRDYPQLIAQTRDLLEAAGVAYVIENVEGARPLLHGPVRYCGSSFGLDVRRHRLFETNWLLMPPPCDHSWQTPRFQSLDGSMAKTGRLACVVGVHGNCNYAGEFELRQKAMGIDWMTNPELTQAIPPAYTEHIGRTFLAQQGANAA